MAGERLTAERALLDVQRWTLAAVRQAVERIRSDVAEPADQMAELVAWLDEAIDDDARAVS